jgi:oxygen-dependent protoporphyrinogen oxidase
MPRPVAIIGGGIAGLTAAYELNRLRQAGADVTFTLVEASSRLGGIVETHRENDFAIECGPDGWVTEKPWARELAEELGLGEDLIQSRDHERVTWVLQGGELIAMPDNMRMMVPESVDTICHSPLFSESARAAYATEEARAEELKTDAPDHDESVASFVTRHFGEEVLRVIGAPLLGGVFGGDVQKLSVRSVMPAFVAMEREHGSLIRALAIRKQQRGNKPSTPVFTSLRTGTATLVDAMVATLPLSSIQLEKTVTEIQRTGNGWLIADAAGHIQTHDHLLLAVPAPQAAKLLAKVAPDTTPLLQLPTSSAVIAGFGFAANAAPTLPKGFGFLCPEGEDSMLLAATFADQKFDNRAPSGAKSLRAYFGGATADELIPQSDTQVATIAKEELGRILGPLPTAIVTVVRRWPQALPQYEVGHLERMSQLQSRVDAIGSLHLLGNAYRGVGLPDLIRDSRAAAREIAAR